MNVARPAVNIAAGPAASHHCHMVRFLIFLAAAELVLVVLALISSLSADRVRALPRPLWVLLILAVPLAGPVAWFAWGRPNAAHRRHRPPARPSSPDDDPDFLRTLDPEQSQRDRDLLAQWERDLKKNDDDPV